MNFGTRLPGACFARPQRPGSRAAVRGVRPRPRDY